MSYIRGRYSWLLRPALILFDIFTIIFLAAYYFDFQTYDIAYLSIEFLHSKAFIFVIYTAVLWLMSAYTIKFYNVYRYTTSLNILGVIIKQFLIFCIVVFAFIGFYRGLQVETKTVLGYLTISFVAIGFVKFLTFFGLKQFRQYLNGNQRRVLIIGNTKGAQELKQFFANKKEYGYDLLGVYSDVDTTQLNGNVQEAIDILLNNGGVDELYCALDELTEKQVNTFIRYAELNRCNIKFIPEATALFNNRLKTDFYNYLPVLSIGDITLNKPINQVLKRGFDILFSLFILVFVLPWMSLILVVLIKLESKGPLFYKHKRHGINYKEFTCYKFRSLKNYSVEGEDYVKLNDDRVTNVGRFLRRTSLDELPQFINVFLGDMSTVGPRPHMLAYTEAYSKKIDTYNFIFRHNVKPGITGLAQTKGYRGEVKSDDDIKNRIKYDIFYIENWSLLIDLQIIIKTIILLFRGDEKAY